MSGVVRRLRVTASEGQFFLAPMDVNPVPTTGQAAEVVHDSALVVSVDEFTEVVDVEFRPAIEGERVLGVVELYVDEPLHLASPTLCSDPSPTYRPPTKGWHRVTVARSPYAHSGASSCYVLGFSPGRDLAHELREENPPSVVTLSAVARDAVRAIHPVHVSSSFEVAAGELVEGEQPVPDEKLQGFTRCLSVLSRVAESGVEPAVIGIRAENCGDTVRVWWYGPVLEEISREMSARSPGLTILHEAAPHSPEHLHSLATQAGLRNLEGVVGLAVRSDGQGLALSALRSADLDRLVAAVADKDVGVPVWIGPGLL